MPKQCHFIKVTCLRENWGNAEKCFKIRWGVSEEGRGGENVFNHVSRQNSSASSVCGMIGYFHNIILFMWYYLKMDHPTIHPRSLLSYCDQLNWDGRNKVSFIQWLPATTNGPWVFLDPSWPLGTVLFI